MRVEAWCDEERRAAKEAPEGVGCAGKKKLLRVRMWEGDNMVFSVELVALP